MKEIKLTNSSTKAQVDDEDYAWVNTYEWELDRDGYAVTFVNGERVEMGYMIVKHAENEGRINPDGTLQPHKK